MPGISILAARIRPLIDRHLLRTARFLRRTFFQPLTSRSKGLTLAWSEGVRFTDKVAELAVMMVAMGS